MNIEELLRKQSEPKTTWGGYDFSKPSLVFVAKTERLHALYTAGGALRLFFEEFDATTDFQDIAPPIPSSLPHQGFYVLECNRVGGEEIQTIDGPDYQDVELKGTYRLPTEEETQAVLQGRAPWNDDDWLDPKQVVKESEEA